MLKYFENLKHGPARLFLFLLAAGLLLSLGLPREPKVAEADALSQYQEEQRKIQSEINALRQEQAAAKAELNNFQSDLAEVDAQVQENERLLASLEKQMGAAQNELAKANEELEESQADLTRQLDGFKTRLRENYMNGDVSLLDVIFDATSMEDFISRSYYMERMLEYDSNMIKSINAQIAVIEEKRAEQQNKIANLDTLTTEQKTILAKLESVQQQKAALVAAAQEDLDDVNSAIATRQKESENIAKMIRQIEAAKNGGGVGTGVMAWPLRGYSSISSNYGYRTLRGKSNLHTGIDIPAPPGTPIYAADSGEVILARYYGSYGNCVIISHGNNLATLYAHQSKLGTSVGATVQKGDVIGYVGTTGNSTGNHLHFEVRKNGSHVSPWNYVSKP